MVTLYVIRSEKNGELYTGISKNLSKRLMEHERGKNRYTKGLRPWLLVHTEKYENWYNARQKEKYYKSGYGKEELKKKLAP